MSCREKGTAKKLECYAHKTAGKIKGGVMWIGGQSGKQGTKHKYGWGLFLLGLLSITFVTGGVLLYQGIVVSNTSSTGTPTVMSIATQLNAAGQWKDSSGGVIGQKGVVSGTITSSMSGQCYAVESAALTVTYSNAIRNPVVWIPYYITSVSYEVFAGSSTAYPGGTPVKTIQATPSHSDYATKMQKWLTVPQSDSDYIAINPASWIAKLYNSYINTGYVDEPNVDPKTPAYTSETWTCSFDTTTVPNGAYTIWMRMTWIWLSGSNNLNNIVARSGSYPKVAAAAPPSFGSPPSSVTVSGGTLLLSSLLLGQSPSGLSVRISANSTTGPAPKTIGFNSTVSNGVPPYEYLWNFGDGANSTSATPTHQYALNGTYTIILTVTDNQGSQGTGKIEITLGQQNAALGIGIVLFFSVISIAAIAMIMKRRT